MPAGRPTIYSEEMIEKAKNYLKSCVDTERVRVKTEGSTSTSYEFGINVNIPSIEGLSLALGISRETIHQWRKEEDKKEFSDIVGEIMAEQARRLLEKGLSGDYNPTIAKLMLTKHGYVEKTEQESTNKTINMTIEATPEQKKIIFEQWKSEQ